MIDKYFTDRVTVRNFSDREVYDQLLRDMLEAAAHAPTNGNMQLYSVVITRDPLKKRLLTPAHFNQPASTGANVLLTFCADFNRFVKWCEVSDAKPGYDNFQSFMSAVFDTVILAQQFCTIAEQQGLGTCYLGTTAYNAPQIAEILELPSRVVPVITVALGYPAGEPVRSDRIPSSGFIHDEVYKDYTEKDIKNIYAEKEAREDSCQFIAENGKETLAQVFTDVRYPKETNEVFSKVYLDFIEKQKFQIR